MRSRRSEFGAIAAASLLLAACAATPQTITWPERPDPSATEARLAAFPNSGAVVRAALGAAIERGDGVRAAGLAHRLAAMGGGLSEKSRALVAPFVTPAEMSALAVRFDANARSIEASRSMREMPAEMGIFEGYAWVSALDRDFYSTVTNRRLFGSGRGDTRAAPVPHANDWGSLFGMAVDQKRRAIWITSGVVDQTPNPDTAFRGLIEFDAAGMKELHRVLPPEGVAMSPGDIALAGDGTVYATDPISAAIYRCAPGCSQLSMLVAPGVLRSPQGIVVSPDGHYLTVADYGFGLARIDTRTGVVERVTAAETMMLDGVDGLTRFGSSLIAIQNGTSPMRIVQLDLDSNGRRIVRLTVLEQANHEWGEPTLGAVNREGLVYVADGGWERFGKGGAPNGNGSARAHRLRILPLAR